jgi:type II secretion system protein J
MMLNKQKICFSAGFTLLELLIAIALMDVIALTLYSSMYIGFRTKTNSRAILKPYQTVNPAFEVIREDLFNVLEPDGILAGVFVGEDVPWENRQNADTLSFFSAGYHPSEGEIASNVIKVGYVLGNDTIRRQVVLKRLTTKNLLAPSAVEAQEEVICRGLAGFDVKYYDGTTWLETWDSTANENQLPRGVQVTLTLLKEEPTRSSRMDDYDPYRHFTRTFLLSAGNQEPAQEDSQTGTQQGG